MELGESADFTAFGKSRPQAALRGPAQIQRRAGPHWLEGHFEDGGQEIRAEPQEAAGGGGGPESSPRCLGAS